MGWVWAWRAATIVERKFIRKTRGEGVVGRGSEKRCNSFKLTISVSATNRLKYKDVSKMYCIAADNNTGRSG